MEAGGVQENWVGIDDRLSALLAIQVHPGLTSWVILSRPCGTGLAGERTPSTACWATFSRPFGTGTYTPLMDGLFSASAG